MAMQDRLWSALDMTNDANDTMRAMLLETPGRSGHPPLRLAKVPVPEPADGQVLLKVHACAVCRTDLHVVDGDLPDPRLPLIPGHEIVGTVVGGPGASTSLHTGSRVGVPWLGRTCGTCERCRAGKENLCPQARFTGYQIDGGFAEYCVADARYCFPVPAGYTDVQAAPLLCAGLIGYRSLRMAGNGRRLGFYGFGAAAHILVQVALDEGREVLAFTRPGDSAGQQFALRQGAGWAGDSDQPPPEPLDAAIIFAPVGELVPHALHAVKPGGVVVCAGIHMSDIPSFPYRLLWEERVVKSVANLTRADGQAFMALASRCPIHTETQGFALHEANQALEALRSGRLHGAAVLQIVDPPRGGSA